MAIRPVDLQVSVPRSGEVARKMGLGVRPDAQQDEFSQIVKDRNIDTAKQVEKVQEAMQNAIHKDGRGSNKHEAGKKQKKEQAKETEKKKEEPAINEYGSKYYFKV